MSRNHPTQENFSGRVRGFCGSIAEWFRTVGRSCQKSCTICCGSCQKGCAACCASCAKKASGARRDFPRQLSKAKIPDNMRLKTKNWPESRTFKFWQGILAEFLGMLFLILIGCGSWVQTVDPKDIEPVRIALTFGFMYGAITYCIDPISGAHINPTVTIAMLCARQVTLLRAILYIFAQILGSIIGAALLYGITPNSHHGNLGANMLFGDVNAEKGFGVEFFISFIVVFVVFAAKDHRKEHRELLGAPFIIGTVTAAVHLFASPYTGTSFNSARSFGPACIKNVWKDHWIFWFGPIIGGTIGGLIYDTFLGSQATYRSSRKSCIGSECDSPVDVDASEPHETLALKQHTSSRDHSFEELQDTKDSIEPPGEDDKPESEADLPMKCSTPTKSPTTPTSTTITIPEQHNNQGTQSPV